MNIILCIAHYSEGRRKLPLTNPYLHRVRKWPGVTQRAVPIEPRSTTTKLFPVREGSEDNTRNHRCLFHNLPTAQPRAGSCCYRLKRNCSFISCWNRFNRQQFRRLSGVLTKCFLASQLARCFDQGVWLGQASKTRERQQ